jgi:hypothetical protein
MTSLNAEKLPYWKTSRSSSTKWLDQSKTLLLKLGAKNYGRAFMDVNGKACFSVVWTYENENYRIAWPILKPRDPRDSEASEVQAATFIHHWVKAQVLAAQVLGHRAAFASNVVLPDKSTVMETIGRVDMNQLLRLTAQHH